MTIQWWSRGGWCRPVGATQWWWRAHPVAGSTAFRSVLGFLSVGVAAPANLVLRARSPPSLFICVVRQGPTNRIRVGLPRSGSRAKGVGPIGGDQLTFSPLISLPSFNFISFTFVHSITDKRIEHISSSWLIVDRFNSYNTPLCFEIDT